MRTRVLLKVAALAGILALTGCAAKVAQTESVFGLLKRLFQFERNDLCLRQKPELRWIDPNFNPANYDNIVYHPVTYYPVPKPTTRWGKRRCRIFLTTPTKS